MNSDSDYVSDDGEDDGSVEYEEDSGGEYEDVGDDDDLDEAFEFEEEARTERGKFNPKHFEITTLEGLVDDQFLVMQKAMEIICVDESYIRILLKHCNWNVERLLHKFLEEGQEKLFAQAGIHLSDKPATKLEAQECSICFGDIDPETACALSCGHAFCNDCWKDYLTLKIKEEGRKVSGVTCMHKDCKVQMEDSIVKKVVEAELYKRYCSFLIDTYVDNTPSLSWCPGPGCDKVVKIKTPGPMGFGVTCGCGYSFCFRCKSEAHLPATCSMLRHWRDKLNDDSETTNWLKSNTKICPQCHNPVEKNGGCNHISCSCGAHFCWMCMGLFDASTVYRHNCNMFDDKAAFANDEAVNAKALLDRYVHFVARFDNHEKSKKLEASLLDKTKEKAEHLSELDSSNTSWIDQRYLVDSTKQLFQCRDILKYTYVFGFYVFDPNYSQGKTKELLEDFRPFINKEESQKAKERFEFHQEELEQTTERLSGMLEMPIEKILETPDYRLKVIDLTKLALNKFNAMFGAVEWIQTKGATGSFPEDKKPIKSSKGKGLKGSGGGDDGRDLELSKSSTTGQMETVEVTKKFWNTTKNLTFKASVSTTAYRPGSELVLELHVQNPTGKKLKTIKISLEKVQTGPKLRRPKVTAIGKPLTFKTEAEAINATPNDWEGYLDYTLPPGLDDSSSETEYRLNVDLELSGHSSARAVLPLQVKGVN